MPCQYREPFEFPQSAYPFYVPITVPLRILHGQRCTGFPLKAVMPQTGKSCDRTTGSLHKIKIEKRTALRGRQRREPEVQEMGRMSGGCYWDNEKIMEFYEARERHYELEEAREACEEEREECGDALPVCAQSRSSSGFTLRSSRF